MSLSIDTLVADAHRTQLIREAEVFRRGREARKSAAASRRSSRHAARHAAAERVEAAPVARPGEVYCRRAAAFAPRNTSPVGGAC
jgi:hypothetical protein